jgi:hypothetical protein
MKQAGKQNEAAIGRGVDWYFADQKFADLFTTEFQRAGYSNIVVHYREAIVKKREDCEALVNKHLNAWRLIQQRNVAPGILSNSMERA